MANSRGEQVSSTRKLVDDYIKSLTPVWDPAGKEGQRVYEPSTGEDKEMQCGAVDPNCTETELLFGDAGKKYPLIQSDNIIEVQAADGGKEEMEKRDDHIK